MEVGTSVCIIDPLNANLKNKKKNRAGLGTSSGVPRGVSPTIGKGLCVVSFLTQSDSGTRYYLGALPSDGKGVYTHGSLLLIAGSANRKLIGSLGTRLI